MASVGELLKRRKKQGDGRDAIRLVGVIGDTWLAETANQFGAPFTVDAGTLVREYGSKDPSLPESDEAILRRFDAEASRRDADVLLRRVDAPARKSPPPAGSPEAQLAAAAKEPSDGDVDSG